MNEKQYIELESLVEEVLSKQDRIIPIIGDDCFWGYVERGNGQEVVTLQQWIAENLLNGISSHGMISKIRDGGYRGLDLLFEEYKRLNIQENLYNYKREIRKIIKSGLDSNQIFLREDVKEFLLAGNFEVIVTTCPFHILEKEISWKKQEYNVCSFAPLSLSKSSKAEAGLNLPAIYQIFGDSAGEFVFCEEDLLRYLHYLNQTDTEKGFGASQLVKYIKDKGQDNKGLALLMPIGCSNLPNWLFRFLWYPLSQERLFGSRPDSQGGVWHKHSSDEDFYTFLRKYNFETFSGSTDILKDDNSPGDPVLTRLTKEFLSKENRLQSYTENTLQVNWNDTGEWDIFISYASEDDDIANIVYDILTRICHRNVWKDNRGRIKWGDEYWNAIQHGIEHSSKFIFIITDNYLRKAVKKILLDKESDRKEPSGVYQEIERIKQSFLINKWDAEKGHAFPLIIDGTKVRYTQDNGQQFDGELKSGMLEKLLDTDEYQALPDTLFRHIQDLVCSVGDLEKYLTELFKQ